jgi:RimJ/RimL family protein N-acetyltransferase
MQPTLRTARLTLLPAEDGDLDALWALWTDPDVRRYLFDDVALSRDQAADTLAGARALAPRGLGLWVVRAAAAPATVAGCAALLPVGAAAAFDPTLAGLVEPLVALHPACWGRGYATEALGALVGHAVGALRLPALAGVTDVPNDASDRMLRRAGFVPVGECDGPRHRLRTYRLALAPA